MITLTIPFAPSRHARERAKLVEWLKADPNIKRVDKMRYRVRFEFYGKWDNGDGTPRKRDPDSCIIPILDAIAEAAGLPGDQWINRSGSWDTFQNDREFVTVTLTPI